MKSETGAGHVVEVGHGSLTDRLEGPALSGPGKRAIESLVVILDFEAGWSWRRADAAMGGSFR
jgi:hypothetical protein